MGTNLSSKNVQIPAFTKCNYMNTEADVEEDRAPFPLFVTKYV